MVCDGAALLGVRASWAAMDLREALRAPARLSANPHYYDYVHFLSLGEQGAVALVDGGGQALRRRVVGRLEVIGATRTRAEAWFRDLFDVDPWERSEERTPLEDLVTGVRVETGPFALRCEVVWRVEEDEAPWLLFQHRLAFDTDPLAAGRPSFLDWPPEVLEHPDMREMVESMRKSSEAGRRYYLVGSGVELPQREIVRMGLPRGAFVE
jgi:hypothetical protein